MQARSASNVNVIDVSHHQGIVDWDKVRAAGVAGAFIKATEGTGFKDPAMATNAANAAAAGLKIGFYHYAHPETNDAEAEAQFFVARISGYKADFPHVLDVEGDASKVPSAQLTDWCAAWLQEVERLTGHDTMIYTGASFAKSYLGKRLGAWPLWIAHYGVNNPMDNPTWDEWAVFQYTSTGSVSGIAGSVDLDVMEEAFYQKYSGADAVKPYDDEDTIKVVVNDKLAAYGRNRNGTVYAPLRQIGESLGAVVTWDAATRMPYVNGVPVAQFTLIDGSAYVSVRAVGSFLGGTVSWDGKNQKVYIYY
ncbi:Copper amine oxidase N-terminal domain-containing protein [Paenibacillus sp. UNC496MF]|uniref:GH25 family lysozyme n=1 Tax=Paenibacillus sp. UNC496MF TaxID=1502753 RepID=UPI0008F37C21|nr:GH25 family lysozyme [Paenibacillus sp. UNC496MF]SFJ42930.1 Copper amine oxidase N-terminal domain-containing protein [Paenibacillus sp. UNC496MF]